MHNKIAVENSIHIERTFDAAINLVWKAWTKPELLMLWFGSDPNGTVEQVTLDLKVGGGYKITFSDADLSKHTCKGVFINIVHKKTLTYSWEWESEPGHISSVEVNFLSSGEKTKMIFEHKDLNPASRHGYKDGWNGAFSKLEKALIKTKNKNMRETIYTSDLTSNKMLVEREFDGSLALLWKAWTDPDMLAEWWAPHPFKAVTKTMDFREGGYWHYYMLGPDGSKFWCKVNYFIIELLKRFTGDDLFCDEEGNPNTDLPGMNWDVVFKSTPAGTKVNVTITFASREDLEKIVSMGFKEGFSAAHTNLDALLLKNK